MRKIRKSDTVIVLTGKDKGRVGKILSVKTKVKKKNGLRVFVENINMIKKHVKPNPQANQEGGIVEKEASIHISNVAIYNPVTKKADRVGFKMLEDGRKVRTFRSSGEVIDI